MAYDRVRQRTVLFGGEVPGGGGLLGDTWEWDGAYWVQVADSGPPPRVAHGMAFDEARQQVLLFGGGGAGQWYSDTWQWDGQYWVQLADTGPSPRTFFGFASDSQRKRVVLFGGASQGAAGFLGDTWEWDGNSWNQIEASGPAARTYFAMAYDPSRAKTALLGQAGKPPAAETWEWDGTIWRQVADMGPSPRGEVAMIYNGRCLTLFGGKSAPDQKGVEAALGDTWEWDGKYWIERLDFGPPPRSDHAMAYDSARGRVVLFGGMGPSINTTPPTLIAFGDTWELIELQETAPVD